MTAYKESPEGGGNDIVSLILDDWQIFPNGATYQCDLTTSIFSGFDNSEEILAKKYSSPSNDKGVLAIEEWNQFSDEIKTGNRFFLLSKIDLNTLEELILSYCSFVYKAGKLFYRARISVNRDGWKANEMGKPPADRATPGRANPKGIPYLYISNDEQTTLFETRAYAYDFVSIGEFQMTEAVKIARLQNIPSLSPFLISEDAIEKFLSLRAYLVILEKELSRPVRKGDNELDYLPSQYLCEFIKYIGFDGVEYRSSLCPTGFNIALFDDSKIKCVGVKPVQARIIEIHHDEIIPD